MSDIVLRQCEFCEEWFPVDKVKEVALARHPTSHYDEVYLCDACLQKSRVEILAEQANKILSVASCNEVELSRGKLKVRLVRFTPSPAYKNA